MNCITLVGIIAVISVAAGTILAAPVEAAQPSNIPEDIVSQNLNASNVTTSWDLSFLYRDKDAAKAEKNDAAFQTFNFANEVEKIHAALYQKALENLGKNEAVDYYVCPVCGNTVEKAAPDKCPICGAPGKSFMKIA